MTTPSGGTDASARFGSLDTLRPDAVSADPDAAASTAEMLAVPVAGPFPRPVSEEASLVA